MHGSTLSLTRYSLTRIYAAAYLISAAELGSGLHRNGYKEAFSGRFSLCVYRKLRLLSSSMPLGQFNTCGGKSQPIKRNFSKYSVIFQKSKGKQIYRKKHYRCICSRQNERRQCKSGKNYGSRNIEHSANALAFRHSERVCKKRI